MSTWTQRAGSVGAETASGHGQIVTHSELSERLQHILAAEPDLAHDAAALADGSLSLTGAEDAAEQRAALLALPGVGPWTADYVRMRVSGDPDVLLTGDLALRQGAARAGIPDSPRALAAWGERLAPWRSYAAIRLWANARAPKTGDA